jgi:multidrug efflux pump subunit AcrA (membrane-fusion protein)
MTANQAPSRPPRTAHRRHFTFGRVTLYFTLLLLSATVFAAVLPVTRWAHGSGYVITARQLELHAPAAGIIGSILCESGDKVNAGDSLVGVDDSTVRSSLPGVVYLHRYQPGDYVQPQDVLGQVFDVESGWIVRLELTERVLGLVEPGQPAEVYLAARHRLGAAPLAARVSRFDPVVTPRATGDGVFTVELAVTLPADGLLHPGMTAWARIDTGRTSWLRRLLDF